MCSHCYPGCAQIVQSTLLRTLSQREEALALVDITTANWQILYAKDSWEQQASAFHPLNAARACTSILQHAKAVMHRPMAINWKWYRKAKDMSWELKNGCERVEAARCQNGCLEPG